MNGCGVVVPGSRPLSDSITERRGSTPDPQLATTSSSSRNGCSGSTFGRRAFSSLPHDLLNLAVQSKHATEIFALPLACHGFGPDRSRLRWTLAMSWPLYLAERLPPSPMS